MQGKTHAAVGVAAALILAPSSNIPTMVSGACIAAVGALMPDTDTETSLGSGIARKAFVQTLIVFGLVEAGLFSDVSQTFTPSQLAGPLALLGLCLFASTQPHRGIMHSIPMMLLATLLARFINEAFTIPFLIGYASHLLLDLLNHKGEQLLWPMRKRYCLGMCSAGGIVDNALLVAALVCVAVIIVRCLGGV